MRKQKSYKSNKPIEIIYWLSNCWWTPLNKYKTKVMRINKKTILKQLKSFWILFIKIIHLLLMFFFSSFLFSVFCHAWPFILIILMIIINRIIWFKNHFCDFVVVLFSVSGILDGCLKSPISLNILLINYYVLLYSTRHEACKMISFLWINEIL